MKNITLLAAILVAGMAGTASAGGSPGSLGLGVESSLTGFDVGGGLAARITGMSLNYDAGDFHAGGMLGFFDGAGDDNSDFALGGRFFYHVASTANADFGLGGSVLIYSADRPDPADRDLFMFLEPGFQIRAFVVPNVALSFTGGIAIGVADAEGVSLSGQATGSAGVHYYFF